jgi:hypothetical protein
MMTRQSLILRKRDFRFETYWLKNADCMDRVKEIWGQPTRDSKALDGVLFKFKKVKNFLKGWGFNKAGSNKKRRKEIENEILRLELLEEDGKLSDVQIEFRISLKLELLKILEEEAYWYRRSHENWVLKGDNNT